MLLSGRGGCWRLTLLLLLASFLCVDAFPSAAAHSAQHLTQELQAILDKHSRFWNASYSVGIYNSTTSVAVAAGLNDYSDPTDKLTPDNQVPMGSTTKMYTAVSVLQLAAKGTIHLDEYVSPLVDKYLAAPQPCSEAPTMCESKCAPHAHCYTKPTVLCKLRSKEQQAACSYCLRYLHCFASASSNVPSKVTLTQLWDHNSTIEQVTFRQLLTMNSGVKDYYYDRSNWLYNEVLGSTRDVEPLEYLVHMDHSFEFAPGASIVIPEGRAGAGQTTLRGAYSTNGFSLIGLAIAGKLGLNSWADLDQHSLAWGGNPPAEDRALFPTRGTCLKYDLVAHQYTSNSDQPFEEITNHSCLNSWLGGNIAPRPMDVARFAYTVFATDDLIDNALRKEMLTLHPMTDAFAQYSLAYGLGLEASWDGNGGSPTKMCGTYELLGHGGLDYGSGAPSNGYIPQFNMGFSLAMTSALMYGSNVGGMACNRSYDQLGSAYSYALNEVLNAVAKYAGQPAVCPSSSYTPVPVADCKDAKAFGTFNGNSTTCSEFAAFATKQYHTSVEVVCDQWLNQITLEGLVQQYAAQNISYAPPKGINPKTTIADNLCKGTCLAVGTGPCWLDAPVKDWCNPAPAPPPGSRGNCCFSLSSCGPADKLHCPGSTKTKPCDGDQNICTNDCHGLWCPLGETNLTRVTRLTLFSGMDFPLGSS